MEEIMRLFPEKLQHAIENKTTGRWDKLQEIRLRLHRPVELNFDQHVEWISATVFTKQDSHFVMNQLSEFSLYRMEEELRQGYITIRGGHRVGLAGTASLRDGSLYALKNIMFFNIRIAKEKKGAAAEILPYLYTNKYCHTLLAGPPKTGKTTLIRDLARHIANGWREIAPQKVVIIDERSEIAASFNGVPQHDVGRRTDLLDACPKAAGMFMMIRSMSPDVLITDEIGSLQDTEALMEAANAGISLITTVHAKSLEELKRRPSFQPLWEAALFERIIFLSDKPYPGQVCRILNEAEQNIFRKPRWSHDHMDRRRITVGRDNVDRL